MERRKDKQKVLGGHTCNTAGKEPRWGSAREACRLGTHELPVKGWQEQWQFTYWEQRSECGEWVCGGMARRAVGREIMTVAAGSAQGSTVPGTKAF